MLDFWIKGCGPCLASFPHLIELQKKFPSSKFELLSLNAEDSITDVAFLIKNTGPLSKCCSGVTGSQKNMRSAHSRPLLSWTSQAGSSIVRKDLTYPALKKPSPGCCSSHNPEPVKKTNFTISQKGRFMSNRHLTEAKIQEIATIEIVASQIISDHLNLCPACSQ